MEVKFTDEGYEDLMYWRKKNEQKILLKIRQLIESIQQTPFQGIGKPEPLKHNLSGMWSRRINKEHRIVYEVEENTILGACCEGTLLSIKRTFPCE